MVDVIMCAIFSECRLVKGCGCGEKFQFALSHWLEVSPYNTAYITVWQCDYLPPTKEEVYVFARAPELVCLSVCLSVCARLLKNACMDLDEMLRVDKLDELITFWALSGS